MMQNSPGIEPLRIASQVMQNSPREHGARATRGRGLVDRTTFPYEDLRDGATLPTGPGTLLAHGRHMNNQQTVATANPKQLRWSRSRGLSE